MGLSYTPTSFSASTTMNSSAVNGNFTAMQTATNFTGTWVAQNNTSTGLLIEDYSLTTPLSQNVVHIHPPLTSPDRGIVFSALKGGAASDRLGINTNGKLLTGLLADANAVSAGIAYMFYSLMSGTGNGTFNLTGSNMAYNSAGFMVNCGTTAGSGGSAASIGYGNVTQTTIDIYCSGGVPWICIGGSL